jgi:hypothetical protein
MNFRHMSSSGALKSADAHRWVPKPSSLTKISDPPRRRNFMPDLATLPISFVGPLEPGAVGLAAEAGFWFPPKKPPKSELARRTLRRFVESFIETTFDDDDGGAKAAAPVTNKRTPAHCFIIMVTVPLMLLSVMCFGFGFGFHCSDLISSL